MHLSDYMIKKDLDDDAVARDIKVSRVTISRIRRRKLRPNWGTIKKLKKWSEGQITADDFETINAGEAA